MDLRALLQASLGTAYHLERELGGGMSRVFVARDVALDRLVVVKVLPPELSTEISAERFRREIHVVAQLQHPHIVPVLSAGTAGELLYYVMPYIEGESLRELISRERQLGVEDALRIAREVADALDYAHRHGIVHRDVKPENILLEDGHAVVADFGIARAVRRATDARTLTGTGFSLGTPVYMSPEQASAERELDGRSDIYSLGCVLYEMLAGEPPFTGASAQAVIAKRLMGAPPGVSGLRPTVPARVEQAVARALAPVPSDRFLTAREFARELAVSEAHLASGTVERSDAQSAAGRLTAKRGVRAAAVAVVAIVLLIAGALLVRSRDPASSPTDPNVVAVVPFRTAGADPSLSYLREGMIDLLAVKLTGEGGPRSADPRSVVSAWRRAAGSEHADPPIEAALQIAERLGAGRLLLGGIVGTPSRLVISATLVTVPHGRNRVEASVEGSSDSLPLLIDQLTAQLLAREAGEAERLALLTGTSLPALRSYLEGQATYRRGRFEEAVRHYERSLQHDSTFTLAAIGLFSAAYWTPNTEPFERGKRLAWQGRGRLSLRDRAYVTAWTGSRYPLPTPFGEMLAQWQHAVEVAPDRPEPWFELGDLLFHFGPLLEVENARERARGAFAKALELDSSFAASLAHLVEHAIVDGDLRLASELGAKYLSQDSTADGADYVRWRLAVATRDEARLGSLRARMGQVSTSSLRRIVGLGQVAGVGLDDVDSAAAVLAAREVTPSEARLIRFELRGLALNRGRPQRASALLRAYAEVEPYEAASLDLAVLDGLFGDGDSAAAASAARRLAGIVERSASAADAEGRAVAAHHRCALELWRVTHGDLANAGASIVALEQAASIPGPRQHDHAVCAATLAAVLALRTGGDHAAAADRLDDELRRVGPETFGGSPVENVGRIVLARAREAEGDVQGAIAALRRRAYHHFGATYLAPMLTQEARLAERIGDKQQAEAAYARYRELRAKPDPGVRAAASGPSPRPPRRAAVASSPR